MEARCVKTQIYPVDLLMEEEECLECGILMTICMLRPARSTRLIKDSPRFHRLLIFPVLPESVTKRRTDGQKHGLTN